MFHVEHVYQLIDLSDYCDDGTAGHDDRRFARPADGPDRLEALACRE